MILGFSIDILHIQIQFHVSIFHWVWVGGLPSAKISPLAQNSSYASAYDMHD